jgi:hypothetical protein
MYGKAATLPDGYHYGHSMDTLDSAVHFGNDRILRVMWLFQGRALCRPTVDAGRRTAIRRWCRHDRRRCAARCRT